MASCAVCCSFQKSGAAGLRLQRGASASSAGMSKTHHHMRDAIAERSQPVAELVHAGVRPFVRVRACILSDARGQDGLTRLRARWTM